MPMQCHLFRFKFNSNMLKGIDFVQYQNKILEINLHVLDFHINSKVRIKTLAVIQKE